MNGLVKSSLCFCLLVFTACEKIIIPDIMDPRLPRYTEEGKNMGAAYLNDNIWISDVRYRYGFAEYHPYFSIPMNSDSIVYIMDGKIKDGTRFYFGFNFYDSRINEFKNLTNLVGEKIVFDGVRNTIYLGDDLYEKSCNPSDIKGQLYFNRISELSSGTWIIAGTFSFELIDYCDQNYTMEYGRFDYRYSQNMYNIY